jgi:hypothetical protein
LRETHLHAALKKLYARPDDLIETPVAGFVADVRRGDLLIEIQTGSFAALKRKLPALLDQYQVLLVHPIAAESWILKEDADGHRLDRRKSPRRGQWWEVFTELVSVPAVLAHPNFALEVLLVREEQLRRPASAPKRRRRWRPRAWRTIDRRLLEVVDRRLLQGDEAYRALIPSALAQPFTTQELAQALSLPAWLAHKVVYVLRHMGVLAGAGKRGRALLWQLVSEA